MDIELVVSDVKDQKVNIKFMKKLQNVTASYGWPEKKDISTEPVGKIFVSCPQTEMIQMGSQIHFCV